MGRPKSPEGPRKTLGAKFTLDEIALIDTERGDMTRSAWIRATLLASAPGSVPVPAERPPQSRHDVARAAFASAAYHDPEPEPGGKCEHRADQIHDGVCECGFDDFYA